eukprot:SAG25_NODE_989_length_4394_cov_2.452386_4_plen_342_part_00
MLARLVKPEWVVHRALTSAGRRRGGATSSAVVEHRMQQPLLLPAAAGGLQEATMGGAISTRRDGCGFQYRRRPDDYMFPTWWFAVVTAPSVMPALFGTAFGSIVWPSAIGAMAGVENKAFIFAVCNQVGTVISWSAPFIGALSDKVPLWLAQCFGRRRPFIAGGSLLVVTGCVLKYIALVGRAKPNGVLLAVGLVIESLGGSLSSPAFGAIIPDTIPLKQRGLCVTVSAFTCMGCALLGNAIGFMLGHGILFTDAFMWKMNILTPLIDCPFILIACNGVAALWAPEHLRLDLIDTAAAAAAAAAARGGGSDRTQGPHGVDRDEAGRSRVRVWVWVGAAFKS